MRVHAKDLSASDFVNKFEKLNVPLVIEGAVDHWKAFERWTPEYLTKMCGDMKFRATAATAAMAATFTMSEYFQYAKDTTEEVPLYLFDRNFFDSVPTLAADIDVPPYFAAVNDAHHGTDLFRVLGGQAETRLSMADCGSRSQWVSVSHRPQYDQCLECLRHGPQEMDLLSTRKPTARGGCQRRRSRRDGSLVHSGVASQFLVRA
jgi:hypothetical protein